MSAFIVIAIASFVLVVYPVLVIGGRCSREEEKRKWEMKNHED